MMNNKSYNYGKCVVCSTQMKERLVKQDFWIRGQLIVIENVPAGVCPQCGEKIVNAEVGHQIAQLIENTERIEKATRISVPAIEFSTDEIAA